MFLLCSKTQSNTGFISFVLNISHSKSVGNRPSLLRAKPCITHRPCDLPPARACANTCILLGIHPHNHAAHLSPARKFPYTLLHTQLTSAPLITSLPFLSYTHSHTSALTQIDWHSHTFTHTHSHTYCHSHILFGTHTHSCSLTHICTHTNWLTLTYIHANSLTHTATHTYWLTFTHIQADWHIQTFTHTHSQTSALTHTYMYTHM